VALNMEFLKSRATVIAVVLTAALLPVLAALQYRWLGSLSELEHRRARSNLYRTTDRFCDELDRDLTRIFSTFRNCLYDHSGTTVEKLAEAYEDWPGLDSRPELVKEVHWITRSRPGGLRIEKYDPERQRLATSEWPDWLRSQEGGLTKYFEERGRESHSRSGRGDDEGEAPFDKYLDPLHPRVPALLSCSYRARAKCVAVTLDQDVLMESLVRDRLLEFFGDDDETDYEILIVNAIRPDRVVYRSAAALTHEDFADPDEEEELFRLRVRGESDSGQWRLLVRHRLGSLEAAVAMTRNRNLALAFGALVLLGASMVLLIVTTRRAHALARQQVEFVAGVSHELRTPLAGISSLSENLADGVVSDLPRAREYGQAIHRETRRLGDMLERVLLFSTIESGKTYEMAPVDLAETVESTIESTRPLIAEKAAEVDVEIPDGFPPVLGDRRVLKVAIRNILVNALKFSPEASLITIRASVSESKATQEARIDIEDRGFGIPASELSHIFEPFYRASDAKERQIAGSGLGLSIVKRILEAQGGRVTAASEVGKGTTFSIRLPVAGERGVA
jgi:signal transduction histidine kinase